MKIVSPYRSVEEPVFHADAEIVYRPSSPARTAVTVALIALFFVAHITAFTRIYRGIELRCDRAGGHGECVLTYDYGLFSTHRTILLADLVSAESRRTMTDKYVVTITTRAGKALVLKRAFDDAATAKARSDDVGDFLRDSRRTHFHSVDPRDSTAASIMMSMFLVALGAVAIHRSQRTVLRFDSVHELVAIERRRWPFATERSQSPYSELKGASTEETFRNRRRNRTVVIERVDGSTVPLLASGSGRGSLRYVTGIVADINRHLGKLPTRRKTLLEHVNAAEVAEAEQAAKHPR